jgi:hypothetical protein
MIVPHEMCDHVAKKTSWEYTGNDLSPPSVTTQPDYESCCALCFDTSECYAFTWDSTTLLCTLQTGVGSGGQTNANTDAGSWLESCIGFTMKQNWNYTGNNIGSPTTALNYRSCCSQCANNEQCNAFTWNPVTTSCTMKTSVGTGGISSSNVYSGARANFCPGMKMKLSWNYVSNDLYAPTTEVDYHACCLKCTVDEQCNAFTWDGSTGSCYLKSSTGTGGSSSMDVYYSGYRLTNAVNTCSCRCAGRLTQLSYYYC